MCRDLSPFQSGEEQKFLLSAVNAVPICLLGPYVTLPIGLQRSTVLQGLRLNRPSLSLYIMYGLYANVMVAASKKPLIRASLCQ